MGGLLVGGGFYCCTAVLLLRFPAVTLARRRPLGRSIARRSLAGAVAMASIAAVVDRPPLPDRSPAVARPPSLARSRRRRSGGFWPPSSLVRRRPLARSPAVVRSLARHRSPAVPRPPMLLLKVPKHLRICVRTII